MRIFTLYTKTEVIIDHQNLHLYTLDGHNDRQPRTCPHTTDGIPVQKQWSPIKIMT